MIGIEPMTSPYQGGALPTELHWLIEINARPMGIEPTIYRVTGDCVNHYTTAAFFSLLF